MNGPVNYSFAPQLYIKSGVTDIDFFSKAFGAIETRRWTNADNTIHVAELSLNGMLFHLHEDNNKTGLFSPDKYKGTTVTIGLFVEDVDQVMQNAVASGAIEISPAKDYEYGLRQGEIQDPFGHRWLIEKTILPG